MGSRIARLWHAVPVPEPHVVGVLVASVFDARRPWRLLGRRHARVARMAGSGLLVSGILLIGWAVKSVGPHLDPDERRLVTTGAYAVSRNPMYVGWTMLYVGLTVRSNNGWGVLFLPAILVATHRIVRREERSLAAKFRDEYAAYRRRVRRYL